MKEHTCLEPVSYGFDVLYRKAEPFCSCSALPFAPCFGPALACLQASLSLD